MNVVQRLLKRRAYPVVIGTEKFHVRAFTLAEQDALGKLPVDVQGGFVLGCCLVNDAGEPEFTRQGGESYEDFAARVSHLTADVPVDTVAALGAAVERASKPPKADSVKND